MNPSKKSLPVLGEELIRTVPSGNPNRTHENPVLEIEVVSDVICPWCWVGKRRLEKAIHLLGSRAQVNVTWRPFQLNPSMPKEGIDRNEYRKAKFGSLERSRELDAWLTAVGATAGVEFHLDRIRRTPNTLAAHRLLGMAQHQGMQDAMVESLFKAYFTNGVDLGEPRNLVAIAVSAGMASDQVEQALATGKGLKEVIAEEERFRAMGIDGVPGFVVNGQFAFSGAAEPPIMVDAFLQLASRSAP